MSLKGKLTSRSAIYAQQRRDNEIEAREELAGQLPEDARQPDVSTHGDFNLTTKTLVASLLFLDPVAVVPAPSDLEASHSGYNQKRRDNEKTVRDRLELAIPTRLFTLDITSRGDFNLTTKVMIAASFRIKELRLEGENIDASGPASSSLSDLTHSDYSSTTDDEEIADSEEDESEPVHQSSKIINKQTIPSISQHTLSSEQHLQSEMASTTKSRSKKQPRSSKSVDVPMDDVSTIDDVNPSKGRFEGLDLFPNLRADESKKETGLNLMPPPLPKKAFQNQGAWEIKPKKQATAPSNNEYVRALEQAANRLVAKAKELANVYEGNEAEVEGPLTELTDMCIDGVKLLETEMTLDQFKEKCDARRKAWKETYPQTKFDF